MRGELIGVWQDTWREIWLPLSYVAPNENEDIFCELFRVLAGDPMRPGALKKTPSVEALADIVDDPHQSREVFEKIRAEDFAGERALVGFFETAYDALEELGGDDLANRYFNLLENFVQKYSLRYELRRPCVLCPTLPGVFTSLVRELDVIGNSDSNVAKRLRDFKEAIQDLRFGATEGRISNCVTKQVMLLEAVAAVSGEVTGADLAALCKTIENWPHPAVRQSLLNLYGFASDFPGVRHGTPSGGMKRDIELRDVLALSILLAGFTPYLSNSLNPDILYRGA